MRNMQTEYLFVGGPLNGQRYVFHGTATWWGFKYSKDGIEGEYNTRPAFPGSYIPGGTPRLFWSDPENRVLKPDWVLSDEVTGSIEDESIEDYIQRLIEAANGDEG